MMTNRRKAYNILKKVFCDGAYSNLALKDALRSNAEGDSAFITALVYSTIENASYADFLISKYANARVSISTVVILRMGITELLLMRSKPYVVCNEYANLMRETGKSGMVNVVNAILRRIDRERDSLPQLPDNPVERVVIKYGIPRFLAEEYIDEYGLDFTEAMLSTKIHSMTLRAQYPHTSDELAGFLDRSGIKYERGRIIEDAFIIKDGFEIDNNPLYKNGSFAVQSESAMLVCRLCKVKPGMNVLDACAAPGGKTAYLSSLMGNEGRIIAWDIHKHRVELLRSALNRMNVSNVECDVHDAAEPMEKLIDSMDIVLIDAPCSGFGGGSKPDAYLNRGSESIEELARIQKRILNTCCRYVKVEGSLIYSTCTVSKRENYANVCAFLEEHSEFELDTDALNMFELSGAHKQNGMLQLFTNLDGVDGFFMARMVRKH